MILVVQVPVAIAENSMPIEGVVQRKFIKFFFEYCFLVAQLPVAMNENILSEVKPKKAKKAKKAKKVKASVEDAQIQGNYFYITF